jgi:hypothetical protein
MMHRIGAKIEMPPALDPPVVDLKEPAGLSAPSAHPSPALQADRHDHPLSAKRDVDHRYAGQAPKPVECGADA